MAFFPKNNLRVNTTEHARVEEEGLGMRLRRGVFIAFHFVFFLLTCHYLSPRPGRFVYVIPPFGVVLLVYPPDYPRTRSARGGRADKPQHHDKRWNKMFITVDWSLLGNLREREGGAVKFFQIRPSACIRTRETGRETVPRDFV